MIILDTNVLSELASQLASQEVVNWADAQPIKELHTTAISEAEIRYNLALMTSGRRREQLERATDTAFSILLEGRVLPFDRRAARVYAELGAAARRRGLPIDFADLQIAAIAKAHDATAIATRNVRHFAGFGLPVINPWQE